MTFTEAAVEVLRLVGKPLHYKKITELAIERNLLSHVGKTPEITMSSRLATMLKKDRGDAPIIKVKPGVFGLREFPESVLKAAEGESGHEYTLPADTGEEGSATPPPAANASARESGAEGPSAADTEGNGNGRRTPDSPPRLPGAEFFAEEEDDDEPILERISREESEERTGAGGESHADDERKGRRRRRRRRKRGGGAGREQPSDQGSPRASNRASKAERGSARSEPAGRGEAATASATPPPGDVDREPAEGDVVGRDLADAVEAAMRGGHRGTPAEYRQVAEWLVRRGRLSGDPSSLAPTIAAAVRGDLARRRSEGARPRFRVRDGRVALVDWSLPDDALRAEQETLRAADRQREAVYRAFLRKLESLPTTGLVELLATWLNAEGVTELRGVRRANGSSGSFHLAGTLRQGPQQTALAVVFWRDGTNLGREHVIDVRGALHHYGEANAAWLVTTGRVQSGAREEVAVSGAPPCALFDGLALARAMERASVGLQRVSVPASAIDLDLLEELGAGVEQPRGKRDRRGDSARAGSAGKPTQEPTESDEESGRKRRDGKKRRRRRREAPPEAEAAQAEPADAADDASTEPHATHEAVEPADGASMESEVGAGPAEGNADPDEAESPLRADEPEPDEDAQALNTHGTEDRDEGLADPEDRDEGLAERQPADGGDASAYGSPNDADREHDDADTASWTMQASGTDTADPPNDDET